MMINKIIKGSLNSLLVVIIMLLSFNAIAQKSGYLQVNGKIRKDNKPEVGVTIEINAIGLPSQTVSSKDNGAFNFNMTLQKNYTLKFVKSGLVTKVIEFSTIVPADQSDIIYQKEFNIDLFSDVAGVSQDKSMNKPVAKFAYNPTYEDFEYDQSYSKQIQSEQDVARKIAEDQNKLLERARLDSLNKAWNDSLAKVKTRQAELMAQKAEQDRINAEKEKLKQDSITRANAAASAASAFAAKEKSRQDSLTQAKAKSDALAEAREKAKQDSLSKASTEQARQKELADIRLKAQQDSTLAANERKSKSDAIAKERADAEAKLKADADLKAAAKAKQDSLIQADAAEKAKKDALALAKEQEKARVKFQADSTDRANLLKAQADKDAALAKTKADDQAKADLAQKAKDAEQKKINDQVKLKAQQDSTLRADAAKQKEDADAKLKAQADAKAKVGADRLKAVADSKAKQDSLTAAYQAAKDKDDANRLKAAADAKAKQDSITAANQAARDKDEADRKAKVLAEIEAKKKALSQANAKQDDKATKPTTPNTNIPKIIDSDYKDGVTEETINENNRAIYRTVVKKDGAASNYQKIVYNWGGVFYFKNDNSITELTFQQELKNAKADNK